MGSATQVSDLSDLPFTTEAAAADARTIPNRDGGVGSSRGVGMGTRMATVFETTVFFFPSSRRHYVNKDTTMDRNLGARTIYNVAECLTMSVYGLYGRDSAFFLPTFCKLHDTPVKRFASRACCMAYTPRRHVVGMFFVHYVGNYWPLRF